MTTAELMEETGRKLRNAEFEHGKLESESKRCESQCDSLKATIAALEEKKKSAAEALKPLAEDLQHARQVAELGRKHVEALRGLHQKLSALQQAEVDAKELARAKALDQPEAIVQRLDKKCAESKEQAKKAEEGLDQYLERVESTEKDLAEGQKAAPKQLRETKEQLLQEEEKLKNVRNRVVSLSDEVEATKERVSGLLQEVQRLEEQVHQKSGEEVESRNTPPAGKQPAPAEPAPAQPAPAQPAPAEPAGTRTSGYTKPAEEPR